MPTPPRRRLGRPRGADVLPDIRLREADPAGLKLSKKQRRDTRPPVSRRLSENFKNTLYTRRPHTPFRNLFQQYRLLFDDEKADLYQSYVEEFESHFEKRSI